MELWECLETVKEKGKDVKTRLQNMEKKDKRGLKTGFKKEQNITRKQGTTKKKRAEEKAVVKKEVKNGN